MKIKDANAKRLAIGTAIVAAQREIEVLQEQYFAESYELGLAAADDVVSYPRAMTPASSARRLGQLSEEEQEHIDSWFNDVRTSVDGALDGDYDSKAAVTTAVGTAAMSKAWRTKGYSQAAHRVTFHGFKEEMIQHGPTLATDGLMVEAIFTAFPESDVIETSCFGCPGAVAGNPYNPTSVPSPGEFECLTNCRHEIAYRKTKVIL